MRTQRKRLAAVLLALVLLCGVLSSCTGKGIEGTAENDILTFAANAENKTIIRIGAQYYSPDYGFARVLQAQFPEYLFVTDRSLCAGSHGHEFICEYLDHGLRCDMIVANPLSNDFLNAGDYYIDLSAEPFLEDFLLSTLKQASIEGHIYSVPGTSTLTGIAYNTEMFAKEGWEVPRNIEEFFALCKTIKATGVTPFAICAKYSGALNTWLTMMTYDRLFQAPEDATWVHGVTHDDGLFTGHMEPMYELAKRFYDEGLVGVDSFSASLTKMRQAFWAGEYAMLFHDAKVFEYAKSESAPFEVGYMPFPAETSDHSGYQIAPEYSIYLPKQLEKDPARLALIKEMLAYLCSEAGQNALMQNTFSVSNMKGIKLQPSASLKYYQEAYDKGNLYPQVAYSGSSIPTLDLQQLSLKTLFEGGGVADALRIMDESLAEARSTPEKETSYAVIAKAAEDFTMLETSYYMADVLKETAGTDIGLMVNGGFFRSNLSVFWKGEIKNDPMDFVLKGVGTEDCLTSYKLSGTQLKVLMEHPIVNGQEIDAFTTASGLIIEYAPWNERGCRVVKLTMEDGTPLDDAKLYTVAAWTGAIDERYITETLETFEELGTFPDVLFAALERNAVIKPDIVGRVKLHWPKYR